MFRSLGRRTPVGKNGSSKEFVTRPLKIAQGASLVFVRDASSLKVTNTTSYVWDFENRLSSVTLPAGGGTVSFKYDPFGRRIYKSSGSGTSIFAYDGNKLIEETNSAGGVVARYSQGLNIDEPLAMFRSATTSYYHADGLGSVTSLSSSAGSLVQTYGYDSFGKQTSSSGSLLEGTVVSVNATGNQFQMVAQDEELIINDASEGSVVTVNIQAPFLPFPLGTASE